MRLQSLVRGFLTIALMLSSLAVCGCSDGVRQAIVPKLFQGMDLIADGLLDGLEHAVYPEGSESSEESS